MDYFLDGPVTATIVRRVGLTLVVIGALLGLLAVRLKHDLHMLQQNSYRNERYCHWRREQQAGKRFDVAWLLPVLFLLMLTPHRYWYYCVCGLVVALCLCWIAHSYRRPKAKKPLVMTARAKRLYVTGFVIELLLGMFAILAILGRLSGSSAILGVICYLLLFLMPPLSGSYLLFINNLLRPVEKAINNKYLNEAKAILAARPDLKTVGITGSYGKTSCKLMLAAMLAEQYITLATPESVNTPMGITRVIREQLKPIHQVFVAEMGAKQTGDIAELCELVQPKLGLLTAIGEQHLETFGSLDNIIQTKFELVRALPPDGVAVLNLENESIAANLGQARCRVVGYGLAAEHPYHAEEIHYDAQGLSFTLVGPAGQRQDFQTKLLGRHNVLNIVGAAAAAEALGVPLAKVAQAMRRFAPIAHRLQLIKGPGYTIIDDAFNSNPAGAAAALEVLGQMRGGKRILVTPGMVELGERQAELNKQLAMEAAAHCDYIILVGKKHSLPLQAGLQEAAYPETQTAVVASLNEARAVLTQIVATGDTVLFENDLPDTYNE